MDCKSSASDNVALDIIILNLFCPCPHLIIKLENDSYSNGNLILISMFSHLFSSRSPSPQKTVVKRYRRKSLSSSAESSSDSESDKKRKSDGQK